MVKHKEQRLRFWEVDALRGLAILLMVSFHFVFDLNYYYGSRIEYESGIWYGVGKSAAILFIWLAGVSSNLSTHSSRHGVKLLLWGMGISLVTYGYEPASYVRFGVLHLMGTSLLTVKWLGQARTAFLMLAGVFCMVAGMVVGEWTGTGFLIPLGIMPDGFFSVDYYPLLPWYGVFLFGVSMGRLLYPARQPILAAWGGSDPLSWLGRRSLWIYLTHQPILLLGFELVL